MFVCWWTQWGHVFMFLAISTLELECKGGKEIKPYTVFSNVSTTSLPQSWKHWGVQYSWVSLGFLTTFALICPTYTQLELKFTLFTKATPFSVPWASTPWLHWEFSLIGQILLHRYQSLYTGLKNALRHHTFCKLVSQMCIWSSEGRLYVPCVLWVCFYQVW